MDYGKSNIRHYTQPHPQSEERRSLHVNETADDDAWAVALRMPASLLLQVNTPYRTGVHVCLSVIIKHHISLQSGDTVLDRNWFMLNAGNVFFW